PVAVSNVVQNPPGLITASIFKYRSGYSIADTLMPRKGYWVKAGQAGTIILAAGPAKPSFETHSLNELKNFGSITFTDAHRSSQTLYVAPSGAVTSSHYDLPPVPPDECFDARFASDRFVETIDGSSQTLPIDLQSAIGPVSIRW